jgi:hypothetical protein
MSSLKKCPGCGSDALTFQDQKGWVTCCTRCPWGIQHTESKESSERNWNNRNYQDGINGALKFDLKSCPYCGGSPKKKYAENDEQKLFYVECTLCKSRSSPAETADLAISRWEQRKS